MCEKYKYSIWSFLFILITAACFYHFDPADTHKNDAHTSLMQILGVFTLQKHIYNA